MGRSRMDLVAVRWVSRIVGALMLIRGVVGAHNETVDDRSPAIIYTGTWKNSTTHPDRIDGTTHWTVGPTINVPPFLLTLMIPKPAQQVQGSFATFNFGGASAIYLVGYGVHATNINGSTIMDVELDGSINRVNQYRDEPGQALMWGSGPIDASQNHTVVVRKTSVDNGGYDVNVDAFILTVPDAGDISPSPAPSTTLPTNGGASVTNPTQTQTRSSITTLLVSNTLPGPDSGLPVPSIIWMPSDGLPSSAAQSSGLPNPVPSNSSSNGISTAAIAGATVGAILFLSFVALGFYILGKRRRGAKISTPQKPKPGSATAVPYDGLGLGTSSTLPITFAARTRKEGRRSTRISQVNASDERLRGGGPESEFSDATSEPIWLTGPPAYDELGSPRPLPGVSLPHVRKE